MQMNFGIEIIPPIITALNHIRAGTSLYECVIVIEKNEKKTGLVGFPIERWPRVPHEKKQKNFRSVNSVSVTTKKLDQKEAPTAYLKKTSPKETRGLHFGMCGVARSMATGRNYGN